jgi:putative tricarboxylic transport membrane protein
MAEFIMEAIGNIFHPLTLVLMNLGVFLGIIFGAIPGLSGNLGIILLVPFTVNMRLSDAIFF